MRVPKKGPCFVQTLEPSYMHLSKFPVPQGPMESLTRFSRGAWAGEVTCKAQQAASASSAQDHRDCFTVEVIVRNLNDLVLALAT